MNIRSMPRRASMRHRLCMRTPVRPGAMDGAIDITSAAVGRMSEGAAEPGSEATSTRSLQDVSAPWETWKEQTGRCAMTPMESGTTDLHRRAYEIAWHEFSSLCVSMTPDEKRAGPDRLHWYTEVMIETGERDPLKIAKASVGMLRQHEQIARSKARVFADSVSQR